MRFENRHRNIQCRSQHFGSNKTGILLLCCRLAKPGRYVSIAACCIDGKNDNDKTRRYPPNAAVFHKKTHFTKPSEKRKTTVFHKPSFGRFLLLTTKIRLPINGFFLLAVWHDFPSIFQIKTIWCIPIANNFR